MNNNKKIITLLIIGSLLIVISGVGLVLEKDSLIKESPEIALNAQLPDEHSECGGEGIEQEGSKNNRRGDSLSVYSDILGIDEEELIEYLHENNITLKDLISENGDSEEFRENMQR